MNNTSQSALTKQDLLNFERTIKKVVKQANNSGVQQEYLQLLERIVETLSELEVRVSFDHEQRLLAIEEYLQNTF